MKDVKGCCMFCGQGMVMQVPDSFEIKDYDEEATKLCNCEEAKAYQYKLEEAEELKRQKLSAQGMIIELFQEEYPKVVDLLQDAVEPLSSYVFDKLSIKINDMTTAHLSINSKGEIKVERIDKKKYTRITDR